MGTFASQIGRQLAVTLVLLALSRGAAATDSTTPKEDHRLTTAIDILSHVPAGQKLLAQARDFWGLSRAQDVVLKLKWGQASKTDAVLTRHFNPKTGAEQRERQVTIFVRQSQTLDDLVLDIAHELVHATSRPSWDPYDPGLTPGRYIFSAIEGEGGEVNAVALECKVASQIHERFGAAQAAIQRCAGYRLSDAQSEFSRELIRRDFYRVGHWRTELGRKLGLENALFPLMSRDAPKLYSSTGNAPYPVALYREFEEITDIACENSRKRAQPAAPGEVKRQPASLQKSAAAFVAQRCGKRT